MSRPLLRIHRIASCLAGFNSTEWSDLAHDDRHPDERPTDEALCTAIPALQNHLSIGARPRAGQTASDAWCPTRLSTS